MSQMNLSQKAFNELMSKRYFSGVKTGKAEGIDELIALLEEIDDCEFAMFSLCLIKEKAEEVKEQSE